MNWEILNKEEFIETRGAGYDGELLRLTRTDGADYEGTLDGTGTMIGSGVVDFFLVEPENSVASDELERVEVFV